MIKSEKRTISFKFDKELVSQLDIIAKKMKRSRAKFLEGWAMNLLIDFDKRVKEAATKPAVNPKPKGKLNNQGWSTKSGRMRILAQSCPNCSAAI